MTINLNTAVPRHDIEVSYCIFMKQSVNCCCTNPPCNVATLTLHLFITGDDGTHKYLHKRIPTYPRNLLDTPIQLEKTAAILNAGPHGSDGPVVTAIGAQPDKKSIATV
jgi:hypothetical protein